MKAQQEMTKSKLFFIKGSSLASPATMSGMVVLL